MFSLFSPENNIWHSMQIVFNMKKKKKKNITNMLSAELAQRVLKISEQLCERCKHMKSDCLLVF